jgi:hypothetical protein
MIILVTSGVSKIMSLTSQQCTQAFPYNYDQVYDGVLKVLETNDFKVKDKDKRIGRIIASSGMSLFSWGENLSLCVEKVSDQETRLGIDSSLKVGINVGGAHRHHKNFTKIVMGLSRYLQNKLD